MPPLVARSRAARLILLVAAGVPFVLEVAHLARERGRHSPGDTVVGAAPGWAVDAVAMSGVAVGLVSTRRRALPLPRATFAAGLAAIAGGMALRRWAHATLGAFHRGEITLHAEHRIVDNGPYATVRHPLYAASLLVFTGIGLGLGTVASLAAAVVLAGVALVHRIREEERALLSSPIGDGYAAYAEGRPRLIPRVW